jgi:23S rRNA pseudouridine955/2504/2580 synthase/23S rRNA pseudouridine1911/1915/1917 synthase
MPQLTDVFSAQIGNEATSKLRLVHRLDKDTSGVMVLAKNRETQRIYADWFFERKVKKTYLAIVKGAVFNWSGKIDAPIGHSKKNPELMIIDQRHGKDSITEWRLLADFGLAALLAVTPLTGRTHQIRVHMASVGLPLAFDPLYGSNLPIMLSEYKKNYRLGLDQEEKPLMERLTLHAYQIEFTEPQGSRPNSFIARLDKKFAATIKMLAKHSPKGDMAFVHADEFEKILTGKAIEPSGDSQPNVLPDSST